jgi:hypothetical protein
VAALLAASMAAAATAAADRAGRQQAAAGGRVAPVADLQHAGSQQRKELPFSESELIDRSGPGGGDWLSATALTMAPLPRTAASFGPGGIPLASCRQHARCNEGHLIYTPFGAEKGGSFFAWLNINRVAKSNSRLPEFMCGMLDSLGTRK